MIRSVDFSLVDFSGQLHPLVHEHSSALPRGSLKLNAASEALNRTALLQSDIANNHAVVTATSKSSYIIAGMLRPSNLTSDKLRPSLSINLNPANRCGVVEGKCMPKVGDNS
jgi:hypothetical protein